MKTIKVLLAGVSLILISLLGCKKDAIQIPKTENKVDYVSILSQDYSNASAYHKSTTSTTKSGIDEHSAHHGGSTSTSTTSSQSDSSYKSTMFNKNDSLFSEHLFSYCKEMMKKMDTSMMKNQTGMMQNNSMMNGTLNMNTMMGAMDSVFNANRNSSNHDFMKTDSLIHQHMNHCNLISAESKGIDSLFGMMQVLRKSHKSIN